MADNKFLFKGIQQVKALPSNPEKGVIYFVREHVDGKPTDNASVYFGGRLYGNVEATRLADLTQRLGTAEGDITTIKGQIGAWAADLGTIATVVADHESRLDTAEGKITAIETSLGADGAIGGEINGIREFVEQVSDSVDSVVTDIIGDISEGNTVADEIARVEELANAAQSAADDAQDGVDAIVADYLKGADKTELEGKITTAETAAKSYAKDAVEKAHEHTNKSELDEIADGDKAKWDGHVANADIHVTKDEKDRWTAAAKDVEDFFNDALEDGAEQVKDTLREIQDYINSDATAAATMTENITKAQNAADKAQGEVDALEEVVATKAAQSDLTALAGRVSTAEGEIDALEGRMGTAEGKITAIETSLGADGAIGGEINGIREFVEQVSDSVDSVVTDIIGDISEGNTVADEIARVEGIADTAVQTVSVAEGCEMLSATKVDTTVTLALYYGGDDAE